MFHSTHTKQNPYLLNLFSHKYFADFLKMYNRLIQFYETVCMKYVLNCTQALD